MAKGEVLSLERFLPTDDKAKLVLLHPVMPWVLVVDKAENLVVWDWKKAETLLSANMAGPNEQALIEHGIQLKAEADEAYFGPQTSKRTDVTTSQKPGGRVRGAAFLDAHVAYWTAALGISAMQGPVAPQADSSATTALRAGRWLAVACENKLVILSLLTKRVRELHRADLENKAIHSLAVLVGAGEMGGSKKAPRQMLRNEPLLALGCSDGVIRVLSWMTLQVVARLVQGHTRAVTCLQPLASQTPGGPELLVSGDAGGSVALWEPPSGRSVSPRGPGAPLEVEPKTTIDKAQPDQVEQMALLFPPLAPGAQELQRPRLVTRGSEGRVTVRDAGNLHEMYQGSPLEPMKAKCNGMSACSRAMVADRHAPALLLCAYGSATVLGMHPISGAVRPLGSVDGLIPVPKGKKPKLYGLCAHPTRPHILAAATNAGLALLAFRDGMPLPVAPLPPSMDVAMQPQDTAAAGNTPLTSPSASAVSSPGVTKSRTMTYLAAHEGKLLSLRYRVKSGKKAATVAAVPPPVVLEMQEVVEVATLLQGAAACTISFSPNGALLAVCWPGTGSYVVMGRGLSPGEWLEGEHGSASQVAWHSKRNMLAVLEEPGMDHMLLRAQAAAGGAGAGLPSVAHNAVVRLKVFDSTLPHGREAVCMNFPDRPPRALFGGALLGIVRRQQESVATSVAAVTGLDSKLPPPMLQLYGWDTAAPLGPEVPAPVWVAWEPGNEMVALGYADSVVIYSLYDGFYPLADLALPETTGGLWDRRQLFVISPSTVSVVFVIPLLEPEGIAATGDPLLQLRQGVHHEALVQVLRIAGLEGGGAGMGGLEEEGTAMGLPPPLVRPAGPCVLMGLRGPFLWLADSHSRAHALPLLHAGVKARMEAARGDLVMARIAADALPMKATDDVARILAAAALTAGEGVATGVAEALAVSWLSLTSELFLAIQGGQLKRALWCLFSLVEGCLDRSLVEASPCWELRLEATPLGSPSGAPGRAGLDDLVASGGAGSTQYAKVGSNWLGGGRADEENEALYRMIQEEAAAADAGHPDRAAGDVAAEDAARLAAAADFTGAEGEDEAGDVQQPAAPWVEIDWDAPLKSPGTPFTSLTTATPAPAGADPVPSAGGWRRGGVTAGGSSSTAPTQLSAMSDLPQLPHNETALLLHPHQQSQILALAMQLVDAALGRGERAVARLALAALTRSVDHGLLKLTPGLMARLHRAGMQKHLERLLQPGKARRHDPVTLALGAVLLSKPQALDVLETCAGEGGSLLLTPLAALAAPAAYEPADGGMPPLDRWIRLLNSDATVSAAAAGDEAYLDALEPVQVVPPGMG